MTLNERQKTPEEIIDRLSDLARLEFTAEEKKVIIEDISDMISFFSDLSEPDISGVSPAERMIEAENRMRNDDVRQSEDRGELLCMTKSVTDGYVSVPRVVGE